MNKALVNYSTKMGMAARESVKLENESLENLRDLAACLVNGDTYTYTIIFKSGNLKGYMEDHAYSCGGKNCKCVFKSQNPRKVK